MENTFNRVDTVKYWTHKILPQVYEDSLSYLEILGRVTHALNELIENNNHIPEYVQNLIAEYINSGDIEAVLRDVLSKDVINVKNPPENLTPASGDGSKDDTEAIQGCIDYASTHNGGMVWFPNGSYLTGNLTMHDNVTLKGNGRYATRIVMRGGVTSPFIGGSFRNISVCDLTIDGNADIQVNNIDVISATVAECLFNNLVLTDGYNLMRLTENGGHIQINNVVFDKAVVTALETVKGDAEGTVTVDNIIINQVSKLNGVSSITIGTNNGVFDNIVSITPIATGIIVNGDNNKITAVIENAMVDYADNGIGNDIEIVGSSKKYTVSGGVSETSGSKNVVVGGDSKETVDSDKVVAIGGKYGVSVGSDDNTIVAGNKVVNVSGNSEETVGTNKTIEVSGNSVETVIGKKTVMVTSDSEESVGGNKTVAVTGESDETVSGNKMVEVGGNKTETIKGGMSVSVEHDASETVDGDKGVTVTGNTTETSANKKVVSGNEEHEVDLFKVTGGDFNINTTNPFTYRTPTAINDYFKAVPFKDQMGNLFNLLVETDLTDKSGHDFVNVKNEGAVGDGVTDDSDAFISAFAGGNKNILIPSGTYLITKSIPVFDNTGVLCYGDILDRIPQGTVAYELPGVFNVMQRNNVHFNGVRVRGTGSVDGGLVNRSVFHFNECTDVSVKNCNLVDIQCAYVIRFNNCTNVHADGNYVNHYSFAGISCIGACHNAWVTNNTLLNLENYTYANTYPIGLCGYEKELTADAEMGSNLFCIGNYIENSRAWWEGIDAHGGENMVITGNTIKGCMTGIAVFTTPSKHFYAKNVVISDNVIELGADKTHVRGVNNVCFSIGGENFVVTGNTCKNGGVINDDTKAPNSVYIIESKNMLFENNILANCNGYVFEVRSVENVVIKNNLITGLHWDTKQDIGKPVVLSTHFDLKFVNLHFVDNIIHAEEDGFIIYGRNGASNVAYTVDSYIEVLNNKVFGGSYPGVYDDNIVCSPTPNINNMRMGKKGQIVYNSNPAQGAPVGWICIADWVDGEGGQWVPLAIIPAPETA